MQQCQVNFQMNGALKMFSSVGGLNPRPLSYVFSALTTRPRLLANINFFVFNFMKILSLLYHLQSTVFCKKTFYDFPL
jgi:hypothetical protein